MAIQARDWLMGIFGAFFLYTALAGVGCCGSAGCYVSRDKTRLNDTKNIEYDEIQQERYGNKKFF
jgi:hypothetical protein